MDKVIKKDKRKIDSMMNDLVRKDKPRDKKIDAYDKEHGRKKGKS